MIEDKAKILEWISQDSIEIVSLESLMNEVAPVNGVRVHEPNGTYVLVLTDRSGK